MFMSEHVVRILRRARYAQPVNRVATSVARMLVGSGPTRSFVQRHRHRIGEVRSELPRGKDIVLWAHGDDRITNDLFWTGWRGYERELSPLFFEFAKTSRVTLDVGAYVDFFTTLAAVANRAGRRSRSNPSAQFTIDSARTFAKTDSPTSMRPALSFPVKSDRRSSTTRSRRRFRRARAPTSSS